MSGKSWCGVAMFLWLVNFAALAEPPAQPLHIEGIENAFDLGGGVLSGSAPQTDAAFAELALRGVRTIVSVDGSRPDVAAAHRAGLRYIHLPIGYDGVPAQQAAALAKLATSDFGSLFVHCHHGKHRGPAAAAIICAARGAWDAKTGEAWLREAGTGEEYPGLYRSVKVFAKPDAETLARISQDFPESAQTPALVDAMVAIDERFDRLKDARANGWRGLEPEEITLLGENFRELSRGAQSEEVRKGFAETADHVAALRQLLAAPASTAEQRDAAYAAIAANCSACHREHRNSRPAR